MPAVLPSPTVVDVLILGAGLAGLHAARVLHAAGRTVRVLDKGRGVGGRAATRRWDGVPADHGAQFFTARSPEFRAQVADWEARGVCFPWANGFHQWENGTLRPPGADEAKHPRYACRAGMTALGKDLAAGLPEGTVELGRRAVVLHATAGDDRGWRVECEGGGEPRFGCALLLAMPVPQALALLETIPGLPESAVAPLRAVNIGPTLAVLHRVPAGNVPAALPWQGIQARDPAETVTWIGADSDKRTTPGADFRIFSLHGSPEFSRANVDNDLAEAGRRIVARSAEMVGPWLASDPRGETQVHRWRYAVVTRGFDADGTAECYKIPGAPAPLFVAGDAFCGAKVEGAWRSGGAVGRQLTGVPALESSLGVRTKT